MRIGILLPGNVALEGPGHGFRAQAISQGAALERAGHEVIRLNPWTVSDVQSLDVVEFHLGGYPTFWIEKFRPIPARMLAFAPALDTNQPNWSYRIAAALGRVHPKFNTIPGMVRTQGLASDVIIARSAYERNRLIRGLGIGRSKIELVLNGIDPPPPGDAEAARRALGLPDRFALHVSMYTQERKNVVRLVDAVADLGIPLVIAGTSVPGPTLERLRDVSRRHPHIRLLGFLDRGMLNNLYAACSVFCLPSLHEGTGLVALEAAAHGAVVLITRNGGPPDYFLDHAEYVDPYDTADIRRAFVRAWERPRDSRLRDHVITNLTWDRSSRDLAAAFEKHMPARV